MARDGEQAPPPPKLTECVVRHLRNFLADQNALP
jgi:hypothetical protein